MMLIRPAIEAALDVCGITLGGDWLDVLALGEVNGAERGYRL